MADATWTANYGKIQEADQQDGRLKQLVNKRAIRSASFKSPVRSSLIMDALLLCQIVDTFDTSQLGTSAAPEGTC